MSYVLEKWDDPSTRRRMLAHSLRGEITQHVIETKGLQTIKASAGLPVEMSETVVAATNTASIEVTKNLGEMFTTADDNGLHSLWSRPIFTSLMCSAAQTNDTDMLEQLYRIAGHFEVSSLNYRES